MWSLHNPLDPFGYNFDETFEARLFEADEYYNGIIPKDFTKEERAVSRQGYAGKGGRGCVEGGGVGRRGCGGRGGEGVWGVRGCYMNNRSFTIIPIDTLLAN